MANEHAQNSSLNEAHKTETTKHEGITSSTNPVYPIPNTDADVDVDAASKKTEREEEEKIDDLPEGSYESPSETNFNEPNNPNDDPIPGFGI